MTTTRKSIKGRNVEQKRAEMEELHAKLAAEVEALRESDRWTVYLKFMASFHRYSLGSMLLIFAQRPNAPTPPGWPDIAPGRPRAARSARAISPSASWLPAPSRVETENPETGETEESTRLRFKPTSVFDLAQTEPAEGHEDVTAIVQPLPGEDEGGIAGRVVTYLNDQGAPVSFEEVATGANGYTTPGNEKTGEGVRVVIDSRLSPAQQAKTCIHEAAHIALGRVNDAAEYHEHRDRAEVEAESTAYVVAGLLGLDSSSYSTGYVAGWMQQPEADVLKTTAAAVLTAVHTLAEALALDEGEQIPAHTPAA